MFAAVLLALLAAIPGACGFELTLLWTAGINSHFLTSSKYGVECKPTMAANCLGGVSRISNITSVRNKETSVFIDTGDFFWGRLWNSQFRGSVATTVHRALGYDVVGLGKRDFFDRTQALAENVIARTNATFVSSDLNVSGDPYMRKVDSHITTHKVVVVGNLSIGFVALTQLDLFESSAVSSVSIAKDTVDSIRIAVLSLRRLPSPPPVIIAAVLLPWSITSLVVSKTVGLDVVLMPKGDGPAELLTQNIMGDPVLVMSAQKKYGQVLGRATLQFGNNGFLSSFTRNDVLLDDSITPEPAMHALVLSSYAELQRRLETVRGTSEITLDGSRPCVRHRQCPLGSLVADAMAEVAGVPLAIANSGGIRADLPAGPVRQLDITTVLPFQNKLAICTLSGRSLRLMLDHSVADKGDGGFLQVSGLRFQWWPSLPVGRRAYNLQAATTASSGAATAAKFAPVHPNGTYHLALNNFLLSGGDGFDFPHWCQRRSILPDLLFDAMATHVTTLSPITAINTPDTEDRFSEREPTLADDVCGAGRRLWHNRCVDSCSPNQLFLDQAGICVSQDAWVRDWACYRVGKCGVGTGIDVRQRQAAFFQASGTRAQMGVAMASNKSHIYQALHCTPLPTGTNMSSSLAFSVPCHYIASSSPAATTMTVLAALVASLCVITMALLVIKRHESAVRVVQVVPGCILLTGLIGGLAGAVVNTGPPTAFGCALQPVLFNVSFTLVFGPLLFKTYRVWRLVDNPRMKRVKQTLKALLVRLSLLLTFVCMVLAVWMVMDPPRPVVVSSSTATGHNPVLSTQCASDSPAFPALLLLVQASVLCVLMFLAWRGRNFPAKFNESRAVVVVIYQAALTGLVVSVLSASGASTGVTMYILSNGAVLLLALSVCILLYWPRFGLSVSTITKQLVGSASGRLCCTDIWRQHVRPPPGPANSEIMLTSLAGCGEGASDDAAMASSSTLRSDDVAVVAAGAPGQDREQAPPTIP